MPLDVDDMGHDFELLMNGEEIIIHRSRGEKFDKISGHRIKCEDAIFEDCVLVTHRRSRERQDEIGKTSDTYLRIQHNEPIYGADPNDNASEDRLEYPVGSGVMWRVTEVEKKGNSLCIARAEKVDAHEECNVTEPASDGIAADIIVHNG